MPLAALIDLVAEAVATKLNARLAPDAAELVREPYGLERHTGVRARKSGALKATKHGRSYYATRADLAAYLAQAAGAKPVRDAKHKPANDSIVADLQAARLRKAGRR
jgi:hypothetical protein